MVSTSVLLKLRWDFLIAIANQDYDDILLFHIQSFIKSHSIIVLDDSLQSDFKQTFILVVHCHAYSQFRVRIPKHAKLSHTPKKTSSFDLPHATIHSETAWSYSRVSRSGYKSERFK